MTASTAPTGTVIAVPAPRAAFPGIPVPAPRTPVDRSEPRPSSTGSGRHRAVPGARPRTRGARLAQAVTIASRVGSVATLGAMLVLAAAAAGLTDGAAPTGDAAAVATTTLH